VPQGKGYWLNPENLEYKELESYHRHETSIIDEKTQDELGLNERSKMILSNFSPKEPGFINKVRLAALLEGLIRIRGDLQNSTIVIEFYKGDKGKLSSVNKALEAIQFYVLNKDLKDSKVWNKRIKDPLTKTLTNAWKLAITRIYGDPNEVGVRTDSTELSPQEFLTKMDTGQVLKEESEEEEEMDRCRSITENLALDEIRDTFAKVEKGRKDAEVNALFEDNSVQKNLSRDQEILNEEKLSRVWQMAEKNGWVWGIVSGDRGELGDEENKERMKELKKDVRKMGYGFWELTGRWREKTEKGEEVELWERSLFVAAPKGTDGNEFRENIMNLVQKYDQDAGIYKDNPEDPEIMLYQYKTIRDGERVVDEDHFSIGRFHPQKIGEAYSKIDKSGRTFVFEAVVDYNPGSFMGAMAKKAYDRKYGLS